MAEWKKLWQGSSASEDEVVASIEPGVEIEGKIKAGTGSMRVNTHVKGEIVSEGSVSIGDQGEVEATIQARQVTVAGKVKGNIQAGDRLEIKQHGVVLGDIHTRTLVVEAGGYFDGQCRMPIPEPIAEANKQEASLPKESDSPDQL